LSLPSPPAALLEALRSARRPFLCTHIYPDGDALGSAVALSYILRRGGADPTVLLTHPVPEKLGVADREGIAEVISEELSEAQRETISSADLLVILDTSEPERLGRLREPVFAGNAPRVLIDHHICHDPEIFDVPWSVPESPSTGNMVFRIHEALGGEIEPAAADALFVAISTDTGWFRFSNTSSEAFRAASLLRAAGADPERLHREIYENSTPERARALGSLLARLQTAADGRIAYSTISAADLERHGIPLEELDGFIDSLKQIDGAEIVFLVVELSPGRFKVSLRSKGAMDVHPIAVLFGGGGHAKAAGCRIEGSVQEVIAKLLKAGDQLLDGSLR